MNKEQKFVLVLIALIMVGVAIFGKCREAKLYAPATVAFNGVFGGIK